MNNPQVGRHGDDIDKLIEQSSLGTRGARQLRDRTPPEQSALVRRLAELRNVVVHGQTSGVGQGELLELGQICEQVGAVDEALDCYRKLAEISILHIAAVYDRRGDETLANEWRARAKTLHKA